MKYSKYALGIVWMHRFEMEVLGLNNEPLTQFMFRKWVANMRTCFNNVLNVFVTPIMWYSHKPRDFRSSSSIMFDTNHIHIRRNWWQYKRWNAIQIFRHYAGSITIVCPAAFQCRWTSEMLKWSFKSSDTVSLQKICSSPIILSITIVKATVLCIWTIRIGGTIAEFTFTGHLFIAVRQITLHIMREKK